MEDFVYGLVPNPVLSSVYSQVEDLVELGRVVGILGLGDELPFLVGEVGADQVHLHVRLEGLRLRGLQVVSRHHCAQDSNKLEYLCDFADRFKIRSWGSRGPGSSL